MRRGQAVLDGEVDFLNIVPVRDLEYQCPVLGHETSRQVIVHIHKVYIRSGFITPLKARIEVDIIELLIVLQKC